MYSVAIKENLKLCSAHELRRWTSNVHSVHMVCTACTWCAQCAQCAQNKKCAHVYIFVVMCAHLLCYQQIHTFMCTLFTKKAQHVAANKPLRPTTADHPGSHRAPQSGFSFLDSDTTRWQKWIVSRACFSGDGVPGTSRFSCSHGTQVCAHMEPVRTWNPLVCTVCTVCTYGEQCAQCAQKNANCIKSVQIVTLLKM